MKQTKENMSLEMNTLKKKYGNEIVRVVEGDIVKRVLKKTWTDTKDAMFTTIRPDKSIFKTPLLHTINLMMENKLRYEAELDPSWKQVIGYCVLRKGNEIFVTHRLNNSGEQRLVGAYSCGTGGHATNGERVADSISRELEEEVGVTDNMIIGKILKGYILDESTSVNSVHLGLVYEVTLNTKDIRCIEQEKLTGEWMTIDDFLVLYKEGKLESWSALVAQNLFGAEANE